MAKRKCEQPSVALLPPCKKPLCDLPVYSRLCTPPTMQASPRRKRRLEAEAIPAPECERPPATPGATAPAHPSCKKPRLAENPGPTAAAAFQYQKDEAFREYNSFHFWRTPLPDLDLSELVDGTHDGDKQASSVGTEVPEEMDN